MGLVDLHLHLLPGLDDGAKTPEESLAMARALAALGYTQLAPSPHAREQYASADAGLCAQKLSEVRELLAREGLELTLHSNAENHFLEAPQRTLSTGKVLLVEAPHHGPLPGLSELVFRLKLRGLTPLIAHPERCFVFEKKGLAAELVGQGALLQLDVGALTGRYGKTAEQLAKRFLDDGLYAVAATDLHSPVAAEKWVAAALTALRRQAGEAAFVTLTSARPLKLLSGVVD